MEKLELLKLRIGGATAGAISLARFCLSCGGSYGPWFVGGNRIGLEPGNGIDALRKTP